MPRLKSHLTTQNILLSVIGGLLLFMATQMQRSFDKSDDANEMVHEIKTAFITKTYALDSVSNKNKDEVIDSLQAFKTELICLFGERKDTIDKVYRQVFLPLINQVNKNSGKISVIESKINKLETKDDLTKFDKSGLK